MARTKASKVSEAIRKKTTINKDIEIGKIPPVKDDVTFKCTACGKVYKKQKDNFPSTKSPLYAENNGYVTVCKNCTDRYYYGIVEFFSGNEEKAIERICGLYDWFYDENAVAASRRISADRSRIGIYPAKLNLSQSADKGSTFLDYIKLKASEKIDSMEHLEQVRQNEDNPSAISDRTVKRWGLGYTPEEYDVLNAHYKSFKDQVPIDDIVTENLIKDLCTIKVQQNRALASDNIEKYVKLTTLYQTTLGSANLKPRNSKDAKLSDPDECWGVFIRDIEKYSPAEYYKDKEMCADFDNIKDYIERYLLRPMRNLFGKTKDQDSEYSIGNDD